jgi:uncharacterized protein YjbI with pentapeptide repeats
MKNQKPKFLLTALILIALASGCEESCDTKKVPHPDKIQRLLETKQCPSCELGTADLQNANLEGADLREAGLANTNFTGANLRSADLTKAELRWSHGGGFTACEASYKAIFVRVDLAEAKLTRTSAINLDFQGANLTAADLSGSDLWGADLQNATLAAANLSNADLSHANLINANLTNSNLTNAKLRRSIKLKKANLRGANLQNADLGYADLSQVIYDRRTNWQGAIYNEKTIFPDKFPPESKKQMYFQSSQKPK